MSPSSLTNPWSQKLKWRLCFTLSKTLTNNLQRFLSKTFSPALPLSAFTGSSLSFFSPTVFLHFSPNLLRKILQNPPLTRSTRARAGWITNANVKRTVGNISRLLSETGRKTYSTAQKYKIAAAPAASVCVCVYVCVAVWIYCPPIQDSWLVLGRREKRPSQVCFLLL